MKKKEKSGSPSGKGPDESRVRHFAGLVAGARRGEVAPFESLTRRYHRDLYAFALSYLGNEAEAAEVVQEALIKAFRKFHTYRYESPVRTWLLSIVRNTLYDLVRKEKQLVRKARRYHREVISTGGEDPEQLLMKKQTRTLVYRALSSLQPDFAEVVSLFDLKGLSYREISSICSIPIGTVKSRLRRGRDSLRAELSRLGAVSGVRKGENNPDREGCPDRGADPVKG